MQRSRMTCSESTLRMPRRDPEVLQLVLPELLVIAFFHVGAERRIADD